MFGWFARGRVVIRTRRDGRRDVQVSGLLTRFETRIRNFVQDDAVPDGTITLTRDWRYRFRGLVRAREQQIRNWLGAECPVLPPGAAPGKRA